MSAVRAVRTHSTCTVIVIVIVNGFGIGIGVGIGIGIGIRIGIGMRLSRCLERRTSTVPQQERPHDVSKEA